MGAKFPYGATAGSTGGSNNAVNIAHTHTMGVHNHTSAAHKHTMPSHNHSIDHNHGAAQTSNKGTHTHVGLTDAFGVFLGQTDNISLGGSTKGITESGYNNTVTAQASGSAHSHSFNMPNFTGTSGSKDPGDTNSTTPGVTGNRDPGDTNSAGVSGTNLNRPAFVGVNFIIKSGL